MERLLTVKEAAAFLNVSEMTVRRWTNAGLLRCYRIGRKRERRFKLEDLHDYLASVADPERSGGVSLGFGGIEVPDGAHLTHLYFDPSDALEVGRSYLLEGLKNGENVLVVAPPSRTKALLEALKENGAEVDEFIHRGMLQFSSGMREPSSQTRYILDSISRCQGRFRLLGDMLWAKEKGWPLEAVRELEEAANTRLASPEKLFLCQYPLEQSSGLEAVMAMETHKYIIYKGRIRDSSMLAQ